MTDAVSGLLALTNVARKKRGITIQMVLFYSNLSFHRNTAHLNVFDFDNFGAEDSSGSFGELVGAFTFALLNDLFIGANIIDHIVRFKNSDVNGRSGTHVVDDTSYNSISH